MYSFFIRSLLFIALLLPLSGTGQLTSLSQQGVNFFEFLQEPTPVHAELLAEDNGIEAGRPFWVGVHLKIAPSWHLYWKNPGDAGAPPKVQWTLPENFSVGPLQWPFPSRFVAGDLVGFGYDQDVLLLAKITPPAQLPTDPVIIKAEVKWVGCKDSCIPGNTTVTLTLPLIKKEALTTNPVSSNLFAKARAALPQPSWQVSAEKSKDDVILLMQRPEGTHVTLQEVTFFPSEEGVINYFAPQVLKVASNGYILTMKRDRDFLHPNTSPKSLLLQGVLVAKPGWTDEEVPGALDISILFKKLPQGLTQTGPNQTGTTQLEAAQKNGTSKELAAVKPQTPLIITPSTPGHSYTYLITVFGLAFLGGIVLNFMPCVLPVIAFKVMSFIQLGGEKRSKILKHGLLFTLGMLISFWMLALITIIAQSSGQALGWGFQLQNPLFVGILAALLFFLGLSLLGVLEIGLSLVSLGGKIQGEALQKAPGGLSAFFSGFLATLLATPCTGPFLGSVLGLAFTLPASTVLGLFTAMGLGMALPYILCSLFPATLRLLPKPGAWMKTFKQGMGLLMIGSVIWLLWVFQAQTSSNSLMTLICALFLLAIGCWIIGSWGALNHKRGVRAIAYLLGLALFACSIGIIILATNFSKEVPPLSTESPQHESIQEWEPYSSDRLAALRKKGIPIFIDVTAKWCLLCQANKAPLYSQEVSKRFAELGVVKMEADWTTKDAEVSRLLHGLGRSGVPAYALYTNNDSTDDPVMLPSLLTPGIILDALSKLEYNRI